MKCFIYPYKTAYSVGKNPYLDDFVINLELQNWEVTNKNIKGNTLFPLCLHVFKADIFIFHWIENVPTYKLGFMQYAYTIFSIFLLKILNKKIIWFKHNKKPHNLKNKLQSRASNHITRLIQKKASHIFTHSTEGLQLLEDFSHKSTFIMHPVKNRLVKTVVSYKYDLLIWGKISKYKGVLEFLKAHSSEKELNKLKVKVIGKCDSKILYNKILKNITANVDFENRSISFDELALLKGKVKHVLIPYKSDTVLSSGVLIDSLSAGFPIIITNTPFYSELAKDNRINLQTFDSYNELTKLVLQSQKEFDYKSFIDEYSWDKTIKIIIKKIQTQ